MTSEMWMGLIIFLILIGFYFYSYITAKDIPEEDTDTDMWLYDDLPVDHSEVPKDVILMDDDNDDKSKVIPIGRKLTEHIQSVIDKDSKPNKP